MEEGNTVKNSFVLLGIPSSVVFHKSDQHLDNFIKLSIQTCKNNNKHLYLVTFYIQHELQT